MSSTWDASKVGYGRDARAISHTNIQVDDVWTIENPRLLLSYQTERTKMRAVSRTIDMLKQKFPDQPIMTSICSKLMG